MNAVLEAPVLSMDNEDECENSSGSPVPGPALHFADTVLADSVGFLGEDPLVAGALTSVESGESADCRAVRRRAARPAVPGAEDAAYSWTSAQSVTRRASRPPGVEDFDALYQTYKRRVYRQCYRMLGNQEDAEDLTQEVFLQLFRKVNTFRGEASFSTWLHRLTINTVLMQMRRYRRWRAPMTSLDVAPAVEDGGGEFPAAVSALAAPAPNPMDKLMVDVAVARLSSGYKEIFLLHDLEGYRHDEIAELLGISEGTSKSQLHKARLRLRNLMDADVHTRDGADRASVTRNRRRKRCDASRRAALSA